MENINIWLAKGTNNRIVSVMVITILLLIAMLVFVYYDQAKSHYQNSISKKVSNHDPVKDKTGHLIEARCKDANGHKVKCWYNNQGKYSNAKGNSSSVKMRFTAIPRVSVYHKGEWLHCALTRVKPGQWQYCNLPINVK